MKKLSIEPLNIKGVSFQQNRDIENKLERLLAQWEFTPYLAGQNVRGRGVDCVHFIASVYDTMIGTTYNHEKLPQDVSFHNKVLAEANLRKFIRKYPCSPVKGIILQPADLVICGPIGKNGGPGHGMIAGVNSLWHVDSKSVCKAGLAVMQHGAYAFRQIRRLKNRKILLNTFKELQ